tara:strand:+ start:930 stop:1169 length:240 start_codon:yes stop_codon:yes gene_type:complete
MNKWDTNNLDEKNKPRLKYKSRSSLDRRLKKVFDRIVDSKRGIGVMSNGSLPGPFNGWMYIYVIQAGDFRATKKMVLLK